MDKEKYTMTEEEEEEQDTEEVIMLSDSENSICINHSTECKNSIYHLGFGSIAKFYLRNKTEQVLNDETEYQWVKPEVFKYKSEYCSAKTIEHLKNKLVGETSTEKHVLFDICVDSERVCFNKEKNDSLDFCYFYETFFTRLGMKLPLSSFECEVLNWLNVSPSQLHPNSWAFVRAFERVLIYYGLEPSAALFFCFFQLRIGKQVGWVSLSGIPGRKLFECFDQSYKGFKTRFFKIWAVPGEPYFLLNSEDGKPLFPLYWSRDPRPIKEVDETRLPPREFCIVQFLKNLPMLSTVKILAAQNDPNALDAYLCKLVFDGFDSAFWLRVE
jgi:hypothetical protein